jgi:type I restriction enzyme R subunit
MNALDAHGHDIEFNFKDPEHPLQLVFVCAMWCWALTLRR